jgi:hypothetical protein
MGALADSRMQRLEWPPLCQTATRQTFLSTSAKPGIAGRPSQPAPLATLTRTPLGPWAELSIALATCAFKALN